jgi:Domain of unknown function (DUF4169)
MEVLMSGDVVNLNRFRKAKARDNKAKQAAENRVKFGRTKVEKQQAAAEDQLAVKRLDGMKRVDPDREPGRE